jgi:hypothetical protein
MPIPDFRDDGYLPMGLHKASEAEVRERFGSANSQRIDLMHRLAVWLSWARVVQAQRFLVDGSFVTAKSQPNDVDCVCWLPRDFRQQWEWGRYEAVKLQESVYRGQPKELYDCYTPVEWNWWVDFFSGTRDEQRKGIIEVIL